jgi:hypothetical protein
MYANATQAEQSTAWNAYKGVLGVWQQWHTVNGSFSEMFYHHGDNCAVGFRRVRVRMVCGSDLGELVLIDEPQRCSYVMVLATSLACDLDPLDMKVDAGVYECGHDSLETVEGAEVLAELAAVDAEYEAGDLTAQGRQRRRQRVLTQAGQCSGRDLATVSKNPVRASVICGCVWRSCVACGLSRQSAAGFLRAKHNAAPTGEIEATVVPSTGVDTPVVVPRTEVVGATGQCCAEAERLRSRVAEMERVCALHNISCTLAAETNETMTVASTVTTESSSGNS